MKCEHSETPRGNQDERQESVRVVPPIRLERIASGLGNQRSILMSYGGTRGIIHNLADEGIA